MAPLMVLFIYYKSSSNMIVFDDLFFINYKICIKFVKMNKFYETVPEKEPRKPQ